MREQEVDLFINANRNCFPPEQLTLIREHLLAVPEEKWPAVTTLPLKNPTVIFVLAFFLGGLGLDRFMLGDTTKALIKLLTCGGCGVWTIIDWFSAFNRAREYNLNRLNEVL